MTDTTSPASTWSQMLVGLMPSFNQAVVLIVTALISATSTIVVQRYTAKPAPAVRQEAPKPIDWEPIITKLAAQSAQCAGAISALTEEVAARLPEKKTRKAKAQ